YYLVYTDEEILGNANLTDSEKEVIKQYKWWSKDEIKINQECIKPPNITSILGKDFTKLEWVIDITDEKLLLNKKM
ncbi:MAG: hypothetical protein K2I46_04705, partial [Clostridia bacterium]|nr:hypothetical protein [Clostridia bacterium]